MKRHKNSIPKPGMSLLDLSPEVAGLWDYEKNGVIGPVDVKPGSNKKFWWLCDKSSCEHPHSFESTPSNMLLNEQRGNSLCPYCSKKKWCRCNSFGGLHPELVHQWHEELNEISPFDYAPMSNAKVWWKCENGPDHEWETTIASRASGRGCPCCSTPPRKVSVTNSLASLYPDVANEWHHAKNGEITPNDVTGQSNKRFWFKCDKGSDHEWESVVSNRTTLGRGCPFCSNLKVSGTNSLGNLHPEIIDEWHPEKNGDVTPYDVVALSGKKYWWKCDEGPDHEWSQSPGVRIGQGVGCPMCAGNAVSVTNSLASLHPELSKEWHPCKNGDITPEEVVALSGKKYWWKCNEGPDHEWLQSPGVRIGQGVGCPMCSGHSVSVTNSLQTLRPEIAPLWDYEMNHPITPNCVTAHSNKKYWWRCPEGPDHSWKVAVNGVNIGPMSNGCPFCSNRRLSVTNSLENRNPRLASEWHPTKNGQLTPSDVTVGSGKTVWWKCDKGPDHEWRGVIQNRAYSDSECPFCSNRKLSVTNSLQTVDPELSREWHPTKNGDMTPSSITAGSHKKVWWKCDKGPDHEWETMVNQRVRQKSGCPCCENLKVSVTNNLEKLRPELLSIWHWEKNQLKPNQIVALSNKKMWWKCTEGPDHVWQVSPAHVAGCPYCAGQRVSITNCLDTVAPKLAHEWHPTKNSPLTPMDLTAGTRKKVWWRCAENQDHMWEAAIANRSLLGRGCPFCKKKNQTQLFNIIQSLFPDHDIRFDFKHPELRFKKSNFRMELDIWMPEIGIAIEYQGEQHFHETNFGGNYDVTQALESQKSRDQEKREACLEIGISLLEVPYTWENTHDWVKEFLRENRINIP